MNPCSNSALPQKSRRQFLSQCAVGAGAVMMVHSSTAVAADDRKLTVGVMGLSRGKELAREFSTKPNVHVKYLCDADQTRVDAALKTWKGESGTPKGIQNWREILDDREVDILVCAAPNHWHAPATIVACAAGKHVYCEKPCSHNGQEGEWMVQAAQKHKRCVQIGTQRRSSPGTREAMQKLHAGVIGRVYLSRAYYNNQRGTIGHKEASTPPKELDYRVWQGPATEQPYRENVIHYNWHWFWNWGGGELANNGVHTLDLCRWGLGVDFPTSATSSGGRYAFNDDQETPDTQVVALEFENRSQITWQGLSCNKHGDGFVEFYGEGGALELDGSGGYKIYDRANKLVEDVKATGVGQSQHVENFLQAVRAEDSNILNCPVTEGHRSTLLCHLGNIAQRTGRRITTSAKDGKVQGDSEAAKLWQRSYAEGWLKELTAAAT